MKEYENVPTKLEKLQTAARNGQERSERCALIAVTTTVCTHAASLIVSAVMGDWPTFGILALGWVISGVCFYMA